MTYDELKDIIEYLEWDETKECLNSIIELHKPYDDAENGTGRKYKEPKLWCTICSYQTKKGRALYEYPCPTIKSVMDTLGRIKDGYETCLKCNGIGVLRYGLDHYSFCDECNAIGYIKGE